MRRLCLLLGLSAAAGLLPACRGECTGVGCAEDYTAAQAAIHLGTGLIPEGTRLPLESADWIYEGGVSKGSDWDLAASPDGLLLGIPARDEVELLSPSPSAWLSGKTHTLSGEAPGDQFGRSLILGPDLSGDGERDLLIGAPERNLSDTTHHDGAAYLVPGPMSALPAAASVSEHWLLRVSGESSSGELGRVQAACGDMDADGRAEWLISASIDSAAANYAGTTALFTSRTIEALTPDGAPGAVLVGAATAIWTGSTVGMRSGAALSCDHDLDGDGAVDLLIGAPFTDLERPGEGSVYLLAGGDAPVGGDLDQRAILRFEGRTEEAWLGWSVASGDIDGDGLAEVVAGAPGFEGATGLAAIWEGDGLRAGGLGAEAGAVSSAPDHRIIGEGPADAFGSTVRLTDLDGDGRSDLLAGAPHRNPTEDDSPSAYHAGALYLFPGAASFAGWRPLMDAGDARLIFESAEQFLGTGEIVRTGDLNDDGLDDLFLVHRRRPE